MAITLKKCLLCEQEKPLKKFGIDRILGRRSSVCRECFEKERKKMLGLSEDDKAIISPKLEMLIEDLRIRMLEYGTNPNAVATAACGRISPRIVTYILSENVTNAPRISTLELICELLDLELFIYAVPKTETPYKKFYDSKDSPSDYDLRIGLTKVCTHCQEEKPLKAFGKDKSASDGISSVCIACERAERRERNRANKASNYTSE